MPGKSNKKDLYLGTAMSDLNKFSEIKDLGNNVKVLIKSADRTFREAEKQDSLADEERAYVLYMKYFNVIQQAKKKPDYHKQKEYFDSLIGKKSILKAIDRAEKLAASLKDRYDEVEATAVAKKLSGLQQERKEHDDVDDSLDDILADNKTKSKTDNKPSASTSNDEKENQSKTDLTTSSITPTDLYKLLQDNNTKLILMDVRPAEDFTDSHISHPSCINIPEEIIKPGTTVTHIANSLPAASVSLWKQRGNVDHIVIFDWSSTEETMTIGTTLRTLKDALFKYDSTVIIKSEPLILECGYEQWLLYYPMMSSNPRVSRPIPVQSVSSMSGLDFEYPDLDEPKAIPPQNQPDQSEPSTLEPLSNKNVPNKMNTLPLVDRTLKPKPSSSVISTTKNESNVKLNNKKTSISEPNLNSKENIARIENALYPDVGKSVNESLRVTSDRLKPSGAGSRDSNPGLMEESVFTKEAGYKDTNDLNSLQIQQELVELRKIQGKKEDELAVFHKEKMRMALEHKARLAQLEKEEEKLKQLEAMRKKEEKDVADLMRMKRSLQEQMKQEVSQQEVKRLDDDVEEKKRLRELDHIKQLELEKKLRQEEVDRLRKERKFKENEMKKVELEKEAREQEVREQILLEIAEKTKKEEEEQGKEVARAKEHADRIQQEEAERQRSEEERRTQLENERHRKLEEERKKKEDDDWKKKEGDLVMKIKEDARKQQILKEQQDREKKEEEERVKWERERVEKEKMAKLKKEAEERRKTEEEKRKAEEVKKAQQAQKAAEQKLRKINEPHPHSKVVPSTNMPTGWEKRLDKSTNRYFYINHNNGTTQWEPPVLPNSLASSQGTYTAKLKEEPSSHGLKRSFSSPDIMKLMNEQDKTPFPSVDRAAKPADRQDAVIRATMPVQRVVKRRDLNPIYGNVGSALTGLRNLGNTCYMNSTIQCLNNTSPLVSYFLTENYYSDINRESFQGMHGEVVDEFAVVLKALWSRQYRCITPRDLKLTVGKYNPMFAGYEQQDSQEFLTFLLDGLHEGLNEVKKRPQIPDQDNDNFPDHKAAELAWRNYKRLHRSIIVELFQGQLKSTLQCKACGKESKTFQTFMFLSVPIPSSSRCSLSDCICEFLKPEKLTGDSKWRCPRCKIDREATKKIDIWKLPPILLIGLNRFVRDGMWVQKKTSYVDFPVSNLDLNNSVQGIKCKNKYNLYATSNHYGTMEGGHYTAFCRNPESQRWYKFDDHEVYEMSSSDVKSSAAYFLYYTSIEMNSPT